MNRQGRQEKSNPYPLESTHSLGENGAIGKTLKILGILGVLVVQMRFLG